MKQVLGAACHWSEQVDRLISGTLDEDAMEGVASHLDRCAQCRRRVEGAEDLSTLLLNLREADRAHHEAILDVAPPTSLLNELLTDYQIVSELGRGGMGVVYKARQVSLGRMVALKVLPALLGAVRPSAMQRFRREAELAAGLKHSNIIGVYDFGEVDGTMYYAMELVEGRSLRDLLAEIRETGGIGRVSALLAGEVTAAGSSPAASGTTSGSSSLSKGWRRQSTAAYYRKVVHWIAEVADALQYAHDHGVLHRDIKPSNLLLASNDRLMISDFGLARPMTEVSITASRDVLGTSRYMSPERVNGELGPIDCRTDVYALGATLYELLTQQPMFAGADDHAVLHRVVHDEPRPPKSVTPDVPRELDTICMKAIAKRPKDRYASASELADDLRRWSLGVPVLAQRPSALQRTLKLIRRRRAASVAIVVSILLATVSAGAVVSLRSSHRRAEATAAMLSQREESLACQRTDQLTQQGRFNEALESIDLALTKQPESTVMQLARARALVNLSRETEAMSILLKITDAEPANVEAHFQACGILMERPKRQAPRFVAATSLLATTPRPEREQLLSEHEAAVHRLAPKSAEAHFLHGLREADAAAAIAHFTAAIDADPNLAAAFAERSACHAATGDHASALLDAERVATLRPGWAATHAMRGGALDDLGRYQEAADAFGKAIELNPRDPTYWQGRGLIHATMGRYAEAVADASKAIDLDARFKYAYACRAKAFAGMGDVENALVDVRTALTIDPGDIELYFGRSDLLLRAGRPDEAIDDLNRILALKADEWRAHASLGTALALKKDFAAADAALGEAIRLNPENATAFQNRAHVRKLTGRAREAIDDYTVAYALERLPGDLLNRGELHFLLADYHAAIRDYSDLLREDPENEALLLKRAVAYDLGGATQFALAEYDAIAQRGGRVASWASTWAFILARLNGLPRDPPSRVNDAAEWAAFANLMADYFRGDVSAESLLAACTTDYARAEAHYCIGVMALFAHNWDAARAALQTSLDLDTTTFTSAFARARLAGLNKTASP